MDCKQVRILFSSLVLNLSELSLVIYFHPDKSTRVCTTEDVEKRLAQHMKQVQEKAAEDAKKINLPGYLNPAMVNVHQFKQVQDKKKLLWGKTKEEVSSYCFR